MNGLSHIRYLILTYLYALWSKRYFIVGLIVVSPILGILLSILVPNKYEATISLATFNSTPTFIKQLTTTPDLEQLFPGLKAYVTSPSSLKSTAIKAGILDKNSSDEKTQLAIKDLSKRITITLVEKYVADIKIVGENPKEMISVLNSLSTNFMTEYLKPIINSAQSLVVLLDKQCKEQKIKLDDSIQALNQFKMGKNANNAESDDGYTAELKNLISSISESETNLKIAYADKKLLEHSFVTISPEIASLDKEISDNENNLSNMKQIYNNSYPGVKSTEELIISLKKERNRLYKEFNATNKKLPETPNKSDVFLSQEKLDTLTAEQKNKYLALQQKIMLLKERITELNIKKIDLLNSIKQTQDNDARIEILNKNVVENQKIYDDLIKQYNQAKLSAQMDYNNQFSPIKVVASPMEPLLNIGRPLSFYILVAFFGCLFLSLGLAIIMDLVDNRARKSKNLQFVIGIPSITRIGKIK